MNPDIWTWLAVYGGMAVSACLGWCLAAVMHRRLAKDAERQAWRMAETLYRARSEQGRREG